MTTHIIYIHGFASVGVSDKTKAISEAFPDSVVHTPTLAFDPESNIDALSEMITSIGNDTTTERIVLVGTSLGGLYATVLSKKFDVPALLINPLVDESSVSTISIGEQINHATGETFVVTQEHIDAIVEMIKNIDEVDEELIYTFLSADDDVIDHIHALNKFPFAKERHIFTDGGHRFEQIDRIFPTLFKLLYQNW